MDSQAGTILSTLLKKRLKSLGYPSLRKFHADRPGLGLSYEVLRQVVYGGHVPRPETLFRILGSMQFSSSQVRKICGMHYGDYLPIPSAATDASLPVGANLHVYHALEYDRPGLRSKMPQEHKPDILKGFSLAAIATQDRPALDCAERSALAERARLVDMESASFIQACRQFGKKCYVFKFVTDTPVHTHGSDIVSNIEKYRDSFFEFFRQSVLPRL